MRVDRRAAIVLCAVAVIVVGALYIWRALLNHDPLPESRVEARMSAGAPPPEWQPAKPKEKPLKVSRGVRDELISRAKIWQPPAVPIEQVDFADDAAVEPELVCRFMVTELGGTTPKFDCTLPSGDNIRVKYGRTGEVPAEIASTRLLRALGFGADQVQYVETLRCYGCPEEPFSVMKAVEITQAEKIYESLLISYDDFETFRWAALERKFEGRTIEADTLPGWGMFELDKVKSAAGGASRAHVDALRLLAVFLAHWDNKPDNQRLMCLSPGDSQRDQDCDSPFMLLQDLGSTFGPSKVDLEKWTSAPIWEDRGICLTSMRALPFEGATFGEARISEEGRQFLARMLTRLSDRQITDLFTTSRFDDAVGVFRRSSPIADWVATFKERVRAISEGAPCPPATS